MWVPTTPGAPNSPRGPTAAGRYFGEINLQFEYKGRPSAPFTTQQVDISTFAAIAAKGG